MMVEMADQLLDQVAAPEAGDEVDVVDDMTRLTLDTIGLCGFNYRFNSFYREDSHPFVIAMVRALEARCSPARPAGREASSCRAPGASTQADIALHERDGGHHHPRARKSGAASRRPSRDLLGYMLEGVDKQTGERLDDVNIRYQIITFLIAGHETTSGLLSFAIYSLLKNPAVLARAHAEMDRVLGRRPDGRCPPMRR